DFFREGSGAGPQSETWVKKREERKVYYHALERRDNQAKIRKDKFQNSLNSCFENLNQHKFDNDINILLNEIEKRFEGVINVEDDEEASQLLIDIENESRDSISNYLNKIKIGQPKGFTISKDTRKDYEAYLTE